MAGRGEGGQTITPSAEVVVAGPTLARARRRWATKLAPTNACATARARASFPPSYAVTIKVMDEKRPFNAEKEQTSGCATQLQVHFIHDKPPRKRRGIEKLWPQLWKKSMICYRRRNMSPFSSTLRMALNSTICVSSSEGTLFEGRTRVAGWICT